MLRQAVRHHDHRQVECRLFDDTGHSTYMLRSLLSARRSPPITGRLAAWPLWSSDISFFPGITPRIGSGLQNIEVALVAHPLDNSDKAVAWGGYLWDLTRKFGTLRFI